MFFVNNIIKLMTVAFQNLSLYSNEQLRTISIILFTWQNLSVFFNIQNISNYFYNTTTQKVTIEVANKTTVMYYVFPIIQLLKLYLL